MAYFIFFSFAEYIQRSVLLLIVHGSQLTKTVLPSHCQIYILDNLWSHNVHNSMAPVCRWMQLELLLSIEHSRIYYRGLLLYVRRILSILMYINRVRRVWLFTTQGRSFTMERLLQTATAKVPCFASHSAGCIETSWGRHRWPSLRGTTFLQNPLTQNPNPT